MATAILEELEMAEVEHRRRAFDDEERGSGVSPKSGLQLRDDVEVDAELDLSADDVLELTEEAPPPAPAVKSAPPTPPRSVEPSARPEPPVDSVEQAMLLGRAPIGSPRVPEIAARVQEPADAIDLDSLLSASRTSRAPAPSEREIDSYWPISGAVELGPLASRTSDDDDDETVAPARPAAAPTTTSVGKRVALGIGVLVALAGAFQAGSMLTQARHASTAEAPAEPRAPLAAARTAPPIETASAAPAAEPTDLRAPAERVSEDAENDGERASTTRGTTASTTAQAAADPAARAPAPVGPEEAAVASLEGAGAEATAPGAEIGSGVAVAAPTSAEVDPAAAVTETDVAAAAIAEAAGAPAEGAEAVAAAAEPAPAAADPEPAAEPAPARVAAPAGPIPTLPSRADIRRALSGVTPALRACTEHRGTAMMSITISGSGDVVAASPSGAWASGADRGCLRSAVAGAHLPRFQQSQLTVQFPFVL